MYHCFLIHSSADGHLGCFHVLAVINSAAMTIGVHVSLSLLVSSVCMPSSGILYRLSHQGILKALPNQIAPISNTLPGLSGVTLFSHALLWLEYTSTNQFSFPTTSISAYVLNCYLCFKTLLRNPFLWEFSRHLALFSQMYFFIMHSNFNNI